MLQLSIVATLYESSPHLVAFCERAQAAARRLTDSFEILLVDDGSPDDSVQIAIGLIPRIPQLRVVQLSRHYGHYAAVRAGLAEARGRFVFVVDCDLEEPPELLACFWERLHRQPAVDVVYGVQRRRKGGMLERSSGRLFYPLLRLSTGLPLPRDTTMARLLRREYVDALLRHRESPVSIDVLFAVAGFRQEGIAVDKSSRGSSTYHLRRKLSLALRSLLLYSALPAWSCLALGASAMAGGVGLGLSSLVRYGLEGLLASATLASLWVVGGGVLMASGMILLVLDQVLAEVRRRPIVVSRIFADDAAAAPAATLAETREPSG